MKVQRSNCQTVTDVIPYDKGNGTQGNMYNIPFGSSLPLRVEAEPKLLLTRPLFKRQKQQRNVGAHLQKSGE